MSLPRIVFEELGVKLALEADELIGNPADALCINKEPRNDQHWLLVVNVTSDRL